MARQIRVNPEALRNVAQEQRALSNSIEETMAMLGDITDQVNSAWDGLAAGGAIASANTIKDTIKRTGEGVSESAQKLESVAKVFELVDNGGIPGIVRMMPTGYIPMPIRPGFILAQLGSIRIIPDEIRDAAARCKDLSNRCGENASVFAASVEKLGSDWEGVAYSKYLDESRELTEAMREVAEALEEFAVKLSVAADRYEELDNLF